MPKAYAYLRVSSQGQIEGHGFDRQLESISYYAERHGLELVQVFQEEGISGTKEEEQRPAFKEMITEIQKNGVRTVLVESLDRLAREYRIQEQLLIYLASNDIELINANTEENVTQAIQGDPMKKAMIQIQGIFSELDKSLLIRKLRKARQRVREDRGKCEGAKRYGEDSEQEQAVIRKIRAYRRNKRGNRKGLTYQEIANRLNEEGIPTKRGKQWSPMQIYRILSPRRR
ncbi:MAG: recombinase family protein [Deltaproteobacteria bacterium]|jgi:DNA invertase Pin-like site-specific DNA recombinase|nr:recombinase family protein [Deltaproteobacteria bacterium]